MNIKSWLSWSVSFLKHIFKISIIIYHESNTTILGRKFQVDMGVSPTGDVQYAYKYSI